MVLDETDLKIISILKDNSRTTIRDICRMIGLPDTTVHFRIKKMKESGVIKAFTIITDLESGEIPRMTRDTLIEVIKAMEKTIQEQRAELDLVWTPLRSIVRRLEALEESDNTE